MDNLFPVPVSSYKAYTVTEKYLGVEHSLYLGNVEMDIMGLLQDRRAAAHSTAPSRTFWIILSVALFFAVVGISVVGVLSFSPSSAQDGSQLVRLTLQGQQDPLRNQTALVDKSRSTVTYYITSQSNHTAVVLYDSRNGYVCYKPVEQHVCYLRRMDTWDLQTLQTSLNTSEQTVSSDSGVVEQTGAMNWALHGVPAC
ncbi:brichos domain-containing protein 5 [Limosa lapponica baueri]|uniref:Brichos domain-containing protein 5 n=1 Tax=Limosa lapponica baueri TaxID=1758121 RepID=A0A2I0TNX1_LIMLA|nr:brichos domain-containing protein 5 [Limosa lapponica baueri]